MHVSRVIKGVLIVAVAAPVLAGCMQRRGPVAYAPAYAQAPVAAQPIAAQPMAPHASSAVRSDLDAMAYGRQPVYAPAPAVTGTVPQMAPVSSAPPPVLAAPPPPMVAPAANRPGLLAGLGRTGLGRKRVGVAPAIAPVAAVATPVVLHDPAYRLDAGDRLRVVVFGQEGLTNSYSVDVAGVITMPLIGSVPARGCTPAELAAAITSRLQNGFIREPYVAVEIEAYRPFFILGEVAAPGQYPFVPNMTAESAIAIAGGFTPRAKRSVVTITRVSQMGQTRIVASPNAPLSPGDTITIGERWF
ncbi:MAG: polysaccharide biosynthesis/export family protein [Xanthobacteraceae bacterium]